MPYTLWVTPDGQVLKCVDLRHANWHNHTGQYKNLWLSVGMAGALHEYMPPFVQLMRLVRLCADLIRSSDFPGISSPSDIKGHMDFLSTKCPGWMHADDSDKYTIDHWKAWFFEELREELQGGTGVV